MQGVIRIKSFVDILFLVLILVTFIANLDFYVSKYRLRFLLSKNLDTFELLYNKN